MRIDYRKNQKICKFNVLPNFEPIFRFSLLPCMLFIDKNCELIILTVVLRINVLTIRCVFPRRSYSFFTVFVFAVILKLPPRSSSGSLFEAILSRNDFSFSPSNSKPRSPLRCPYLVALAAVILFKRLSLKYFSFSPGGTALYSTGINSLIM